MNQHPPEVKAYLDRLYAEDRRQHACRATTPDEFAAWQTEARRAFRELLGLPRIAAQAAAQVAVEGDGHAPRVDLEERAEDMGTYARFRGRIETEPDVTTHFWLLRPKTPGPYPLAVTPHGHENGDTYVGIWEDDQTRQRIIDDERDVAVQAVERGFLTIAPATRGIGSSPHAYKVEDVGERHGNRHCVCHSWQVVQVGRTLLGERVWDLMRILDWATGLPEVDAQRVLMLGNSGGGMATAHTAACDERIAVAVPCCSYSNYMSPHGTLRHCPCNAIPGLFEFGEFWDVAGLIAPRPLLTVNGRHDALHPVEEVDAAVARLEAIYRAAGAEGRYQHRYGPAGHRFYRDIMWEWIDATMDLG